MFGAAPLGEYRLAHQTVVTTTDQFSGSIGSVGNAGMSMIQQDPGRYRRYFERVVFLTALCTMPIAVYGTVHAGLLTRVMFGRGWGEVAIFFAIFAAAAFVRPVQGTLSSVLISRGQSSRLLRMVLGNKVVFLVCLILVYRRGPVAIAAVHVICPLLVFVPNVRYALAGSPITIRQFLRAFRTPALASIAMGIGLVSLGTLVPIENPLVALLSWFAVGTFLYVLALFLVPGGRHDLDVAVADLAGSAPSWVRRALLALPTRSR